MLKLFLHTDLMPLAASRSRGAARTLSRKRSKELAMLVKVILVDVNPKMVKAWQATFEENPEVDIIEGSMLAQNVTAWVSPTNARGSMDGGLDVIVKNYLGAHVEKRLQQEIAARHNGLLPVGFGTCV